MPKKIFSVVSTIAVILVVALAVLLVGVRLVGVYALCHPFPVDDAEIPNRRFGYCP